MQQMCERCVLITPNDFNTCAIALAYVVVICFVKSLLWLTSTSSLTSNQPCTIVNPSMPKIFDWSQKGWGFFGLDRSIYSRWRGIDLTGWSSCEPSANCVRQPIETRDKSRRIRGTTEEVPLPGTFWLPACNQKDSEKHSICTWQWMITKFGF